MDVDAPTLNAIKAGLAPRLRRGVCNDRSNAEVEEGAHAGLIECGDKDSCDDGGGTDSVAV